MRILVTDGMEKEAIAQLRRDGHEVVEQFYEPEALGAALQEFDCVVVRSKTKVRANHIDEAIKGKLKLVIRGGVGVDNIDVAYAESKGVTVRNTPAASTDSVAELAIGHMFALARYIAISNATMRNGQWNKKQYEGVELAGKTLGLIGFGRIAQGVARRAEALGMKIVYNDFLGANANYPQYSFLSQEDLLKVSDFVSLHIPMPADKKAIIGAEQLATMKPTAYIINTARGGLIDEAALLDALNEDRLAGAALDVFAQEPTANEALVNHPKVSVTPHIGGSTAEAQGRIGGEIVSIINNF